MSTSGITELKRFDAGDPDGLRDLPRGGRPPKIPREIMVQIIEQAIQPKCTSEELQKIIREDTGTRLYITNVRKAMRRHGLTPKIPQKVHTNRAGKEAVRGWQYRFDKRVSRLEGDGFIIVDVRQSLLYPRCDIQTQILVSARRENSRTVHRKPQEDRGLQGHRQGRQAVLQDAREL